MENIIYLDSWFNWLFVASLTILALLLTCNTEKFKNFYQNFWKVIKSTTPDERRSLIQGLIFVIGLVIGGVLLYVTVPIIKSPLIFLSISGIGSFFIIALVADYEEDKYFWVTGLKAVFLFVLICAFGGYTIQICMDETFGWGAFLIRLFLLALCWAAFFPPNTLFKEERWS